MKYTYTILPESLHPIADQTANYFIMKRGVRATNIKVEQPIDIELPLRPTFTAKTRYHHTLCIEVSEFAYNSSLDTFVLKCMNQGLPIKLFIAIPKGTHDPEYSRRLSTAKARGVGVLEVNEKSVDVVQEAIALSLAGVRPIAVQEFPAKLRESLTRAETMFRDGSPDKACSLIFDEIENICRAVARKTYDEGHWTGGAVNFRFETDPWANLMQLMGARLNAKQANCPKLTAAFLARIHGVTPHRNESGHKPANAEVLKKRDRELRTRFESAVDLLGDLITAVKPVRLI